MPDPSGPPSYLHGNTAQQRLSLDKVSDAISRWDILYSEAGFDELQLAVLTVEYYESLSEEGVGDTSFDVICKMAKKRCRYFPKIADLLEFFREYSANPGRYTQSVPQIAPEYWRDKTEEEVAMNKKRMAILLKVATKQITVEEGLRLQAELTGD